jgi:hypothetical protein
MPTYGPEKTMSEVQTSVEMGVRTIRSAWRGWAEAASVAIYSIANQTPIRSRAHPNEVLTTVQSRKEALLEDPDTRNGLSSIQSATATLAGVLADVHKQSTPEHWALTVKKRK